MCPDAPVLGFDTSGPFCAAALVAGERVLAARCEAMERGQAERLVPLLLGLLAEAGAGLGDLAAIGVGTGPGNFTGTRIAVAAARGLALGLSRPAIGVSQFDALAEGAPRPLLVVLPARDGLLAAVLHDPGPAAPLSGTAEALAARDWPAGLALAGPGAADFARASGRAPPSADPGPGALAVAIARIAEQPHPARTA